MLGKIFHSRTLRHHKSSKIRFVRHNEKLKSTSNGNFYFNALLHDNIHYNFLSRWIWDFNIMQLFNLLKTKKRITFIHIRNDDKCIVKTRLDQESDSLSFCIFLKLTLPFHCINKIPMLLCDIWNGKLAIWSFTLVIVIK